MYVEFLVNAPELRELFVDYIAYLMLSQRLLENRLSERDGAMLGVTKGLQDATTALRHAVDQNYPPNFRTYIPTAAARIIQKTPDAENYFIERLYEKRRNMRVSAGASQYLNL